MILEEGGTCAPAERKTGVEVTGHTKPILPDSRSELQALGSISVRRGAEGVPHGMGGPRDLPLPVTYNQDPVI